jgi:hypothetical protein
VQQKPEESPISPIETTRPGGAQRSLSPFSRTEGLRPRFRRPRLAARKGFVPVFAGPLFAVPV